MDIITFRKYYDTYYVQLYHFLCLYTKDTFIIEDTIQDIFLILWKEQDKIEINHIKTYLFHAARNRILNYIRDEENRHRIIEKWFYQQQTDNAGKDCFDIELLINKVNNVIEELPQKCKEIYRLSREENLTYKQIAERLNISTKTVESQMGIAIKRIKEKLNKNIILLLVIYYYLNN